MKYSEKDVKRLNALRKTLVILIATPFIILMFLWVVGTGEKSYHPIPEYEKENLVYDSESNIVYKITPYKKDNHTLKYVDGNLITDY